MIKNIVYRTLKKKIVRVFYYFYIAGKFSKVFSKKRIAQKKKFNEKKFLHECYYCGVIELDKDVEFRISSKDDQEYCLLHLKEENC